MGCASSVSKDRRGSKVTIGSLESNLAESSAVKKRYGHPSYYKGDGYEVGLRVKVKSTHQSFFVGTSRSNGEKVTIKEHHTAQSNEADILEEVGLLARLSHASIPKLTEVFITNISVFMVTNFVDSMRLKHFVDVKNKTTRLSIPDSRSVVRSIISATAYCHANNVIIRNLTADNIMVKSSAKDCFEVMITDFSLAVPAGSLKVLCDHTLFEWDSVPYMAPEALLGHPYSFAMDVWSIGVLLFSMVSGELPFESDDDQELIRLIKFANFTYNTTLPVWSGPTSDKLKYMIGQCLVAGASDRPASKDLMKSEWLVVG